MLRGLYAAATSLVAAGEQQEVTAHNLAHTSTPGYRERGVTFETFDRVLGRTASATGDITGTHQPNTPNTFRPGSYQQTGSQFDMAIGESDRFFVVKGPNGPLFTRNGVFHPSDGKLVSQGGYELQGADGPITFPPETVKVNIAEDGSVTADGAPVGTVRLVRFENPQKLISVGPTLFSAPQGTAPQDAPGQVMQGWRESSNVQPADAMVRMIIGARYYDAASRSLKAIAESIQLNTKPQ